MSSTLSTTKIVLKFLLIFISFYLISIIFSNVAHAGSVINRAPTSLGLISGLVGYWSFDGLDMAGLSALDRSGSYATGTLTNGPVRAVGRIGQALEFDGVNDELNMGDVTFLDGLSAFTVSAWIKTSKKLTDERQFADKSTCDGSPSQTDFEFLNGANFSKVRFVVSNGTTIFIGSDSATSIDDEVWHHVVGWAGGGNFKVFVDGKEETNNTWSGSLSNSSFNLQIGNCQGTSFNWPGSIDGVRIYNRALSPDEIRRLYKIGATFKINVPSNTGTLKDGLVGYWSFDGPDMAQNASSVLTTYDRIGNNNHGT